MKLYHIPVCAGMIFALQGAEPVLHYDFSGPEICKGGKFKAPEMVGNVEIDTEQNCLQLQPKNYLTIPESASLSLLEGGTLYAVVYFDDDGTKDGTDGAHDMLFFKNKSFLLGKDRGKLYFNLGDGRKWNSGIRCSLPVRNWCAAAVTVTKESHGDRNFYTAKIYLDGKLEGRETWQFKGEDNAERVTFGCGWGGPWFMKGKVAEMRIYPVPLSAEECKKISEASLRNLRKK